MQQNLFQEAAHHRFLTETCVIQVKHLNISQMKHINEPTYSMNKFLSTHSAEPDKEVHDTTVF